MPQQKPRGSQVAAPQVALERQPGAHAGVESSVAPFFSQMYEARHPPGALPGWVQTFRQMLPETAPGFGPHDAPVGQSADVPHGLVQ
jgi:hypothetical protein